MIITTRRLVRAAAVAGVIALVPGLDAGAEDNDELLLGRAVLPVNTYFTGPNSPPAGSALTTVNPPVTLPLPGQPVQGLSAIVEDTGGKWLAMADNGFGSKANSFDFLIRAYRLKIDFRTADGGSGNVKVQSYLSFSDPDGHLGFPIQNEGTRDRLLTGADIDPESLQIGPNGDLWVGEEFGPWILHFNRKGELLEPPIQLEDGTRAATNPLPGGPVTLPNSRGFEAMGIAGQYLYPILEGARTDEADMSVRRMYEYDTVAGDFTGRTWQYQATPGLGFVADAAPLDANRLVVVERDNGVIPGVERRVYVVDLRQVGANGFLVKQEVADLARIPDPNDVAVPINPGDIGVGDPFRVTCESVEAIRVVAEDRVLVGCDNNFPNRSRNLVRADDNEFIVVQVPEL
jgi:glycerophosphoryl diester phosphodiesterase